LWTVFRSTNETSYERNYVLKKLLIIVAVVALAAFALTGCSGETLDGRYTLSALENAAGDDLMPMLEIAGESASDVYVEFTEDGNFTIAMDFIDRSESGTYTVDGNTVTLIVSDGNEASETEGTIDGDSITFVEEEGGKLVFTK
jgi:hypothetical protein